MSWPNEVGLDEYEVRNARGWDRHMILLWALALLSVVRAASCPRRTPKKGTIAPVTLRVSAGGRSDVQARPTRKPQPYRCRVCRRDFLVKTYTVMHGFHLGCRV